MTSKNKIALIYAGGTIGMQVKDNTLAPPENEKDFQNACKIVIKEFQEKNKEKVDFFYFDKKDSTERIPNDWIKIFMLLEKIQDKYKAVIVAHGTDTLANTASAISYAFCHPKFPGESSLSFPIIFTASQQPIYNSGGDGKFNLYHALETALQMSEKGINKVGICFWDQFLLGVRAMKTHDKKFDAFNSPASQPIGLINSIGVEISNFIEPIKYNKKAKSPNFSNGITILEITPETSEGVITLLSEAEETYVLILKTLGEGNIPKRLIKEIKQQTEKGKIIVLMSPFAGGSVGGAIYELGAEAIKAGAISAGDMVPPAVSAKCAWLIGNNITNSGEFAQFFGKNYVGEITLRKS